MPPLWYLVLYVFIFKQRFLLNIFLLTKRSLFYVWFLFSWVRYPDISKWLFLLAGIRSVGLYLCGTGPLTGPIAHIPCGTWVNMEQRWNDTDRGKPKDSLRNLCQWYCNKFAGSIHNGTLLHWKLNTQLLITVHNSSRILTQLWQILELQQMRVMSSGF
jgi:hypothetical protein